MEPDRNLTRDDVVQMLATAPERVRDLLAGIEESRLTYRHGPAFNTLQESIAHLHECAKAFDIALRGTVDGKESVDAASALNPSLAADLTLPSRVRLEEMVRLRRKAMDLMRNLPDEMWMRPVPDASLAEPTLLDYCRVVATHEIAHLSQVRNSTSLLPV